MTSVFYPNCKLPGIVGIMTVVSNAYPDKTQFDKKVSISTQSLSLKTHVDKC